MTAKPDLKLVNILGPSRLKAASSALLSSMVHQAHIESGRHLTAPSQGIATTVEFDAARAVQSPLVGTKARVVAGVDAFLLASGRAKLKVKRKKERRDAADTKHGA